MKRKVRILAMPKAEKGTQGTGTGMNGHAFPMFTGPSDFSTPETQVNKTVNGDPNPNVEAEKGETLWDDRDKDGLSEHYKIKGSKHSQGGTGIDMGKSGFIFSDTKSMKITDEDILKMFNKTSKKGLTPAKIAEQYDINEYLKILKDPNSDKIQRETAEKMINNYNLKLGQLALVQESQKGFDQGVPDIAMPYLEAMGLNPQMFDMFPQVETAPVMKMGGKLPTYPDGGGGKKGKKEYEHINREDYSKLNNEFDVLYGKEQGKFASQHYDPKQGTYTWKDAKGVSHNVDMNDFKSRHEEWVTPEYGKMYGKDANFFNDLSSQSPETRKQAAGFFQKSYDTFLEGHGIQPYFKGKGTDDPYGYDNMFGVYTMSAPGFKKKIPADPARTVETPEGPIVEKTPPAARTFKPTVNTLEPGVQQNTPNEYWLQDQIRQFGNTRDYLTAKKYLPWQATPDVAMVQGTFYDPNREIAANAEMAQMMEQNLATFQGPQVASARAGEIQGNAAKTIADTMGRYNNLNVGVANQLDQMNASIYNTASAQRAGLATQMFDKNTIANQQFDNTRTQILHNMDDTQINAETNRAYTSNMNALYPQYNIHPELGGNMAYTGVPGQVTPHYTDPDALLKKYTELKKAGITDEATIRFLMGQKTAPVNDDPRAAYMASMGYPG